VVLALVLSAALSAFADDRAPIPDRGARTGVVAALKKEFRAEFRSKDADVKRTLARKLLERAAGAKDDVARRYVLLEQAAKLAESARDLDLALACVERMAAGFQMKRGGRELASVNAVVKGAKGAGVLAEGASAAIDAAGRALSEDDVATAGKAVAAAKKLAKAAKMGGLVARASELAKLVTAGKRLASMAAASRKAPAEAPEAVHDTRIGRALCFISGDWDAGLPLLAKGEAGALKELATTSAPTDMAGRIALADGWWTAADGEKSALAAARMRARAGDLYEQALPDAAADARTHVQARLDAITYSAWDGAVALTKDFSKFGPAHLALATIRAFIKKKNSATEGSSWRTRLPKFPSVTFGKGATYLWHLTTNKGDITLRFFHDTAPNHVANFLYLTELGFFDGLTFHRVMTGFMAQGGCPKGDGTGTPGYKFAGEFDSDRKHDTPGLLSMANSGPGTDGAQFFITFQPYPSLNGIHTIFGEVIDGMDTVKALEACGTTGGKPTEHLVIEKARVSVR